MLTRRGLFGRLLVAASAFVVAPALRVDASPDMGRVYSPEYDFEVIEFNEPLGKPATVEQLAASFRSRQSGPISDLKIATSGVKKLNLDFFRDDGGFWETPMGKRQMRDARLT